MAPVGPYDLPGIPSGTQTNDHRLSGAHQADGVTVAFETSFRHLARETFQSIESAFVNTNPA